MYKIAVAGCGMMSSTWIEYALSRKDCEIVALVDIVPEHANEKKEKFNIDVPVYDNLKSALLNESIDIVFDITPPESHYDIVSTALLAGCNVFGEKPMSDSLENSYKLVELSNKTGKEYFVMQNRRYIDHLYGFKNFLQDKNMGEIGQLTANFQLNPHFGGFRDSMDSPLIADMAIHTFDAARFILNKNPKSVYCREFNPSWSWYKGNASAICIFEMDDGTIFDYRGSWCTNGLSTSWESEWRASCTSGSAFWNGFDKMYYQIEDANATKDGLTDEGTGDNYTELDPAKLELTGHQGCINEMFTALTNGTRPQTDCRDNIKSIEMVFKAIESARTNKVVYL